MLRSSRPSEAICSLYDMDIVFDPPKSGLFSEVYLYEELMEADLHAIVSEALQNRIYATSCFATRIVDTSQIRSGQPLSDAHFQSFLYQTLCGLKVNVSRVISLC